MQQTNQLRKLYNYIKAVIEGFYNKDLTQTGKIH